MAGKHGSATPQRRCTLTLGTALLATIMLASCSSDDGGDVPLDDPPVLDPDNDDRPGLAIEGLNGTPADQLTSPWLVHMYFFRRDSRTPGTGDAFVQLLPFAEDYPVSDHLDFYTPQLDTCEIFDLSDVGDGGGDNTYYGVSGGQSLMLNTSSGSWFELFQDEDAVGIYETDDGLPGAFPDDLTLTIPGDVFPAIVDYPLAEPVAPVRILPASDVLTLEDAQTPFTWIPGEEVPGGYIELAGIAYDSNGDFLGFPVVCAVVDDGSFTMPQEVVDAFSDIDYTITARFERVLQRVDFIDGVVIRQKTTVSE